MTVHVEFWFCNWGAICKLITVQPTGSALLPSNRQNLSHDDCLEVKRLSILVTERWALSWSRYRQSAGRWLRHPPSGRLPLLSARPAVTFPAAEHHRPLTGTKLYCLATEAHRCEQFAQGCYAALPRVGFEPTTCWSQVQRSTRCATVPPQSGG